MKKSLTWCLLTILYLGCLSLVLTLPASYAKIDKHSVVVWLFNEGKGDAVADFSGNGHEGKFDGNPKWVKAEFSMGLEIPGDDSGYVVVESSDKLKLEQLTIEAWVKVEKATGKWQGIICKQNSGCTNRNYGIWVHNTNGNLHAQIGFGGGCDYSIDGTTVITDNKWHHLAFTYDGKMGRLYVDGKMETETPYGKTPHQSDDPITIGVPNLNNANGLLGIIDEARISNIARTEAEINEAMTKGLAVLLGVEPTDKLTATWGKIKKSF